jgi:hypothetical protein
VAVSIGQLALSLVASPRGLTSGLDAASSRVQAFAKGMTGAMTGVGGAVGSLGGVGDTVMAWMNTLFGGMNTLNEIDAVAKAADALGLTTEEMAGFQHASEMSGASAETFNKSIGIMLKNLGKANTFDEMTFGEGIEEAGEAADGAKDKFERFGLSTQELAGMGTRGALEAIAEAYSAMEDPVERVALATTAFGKSGMALDAVLKEGKAGLAGFIDEANTLGLTFSALDAANVDLAGDAMDRIGAAFVGIKRQMAIEFAPIITALTENFVDWLKSVGGIPAVVKTVASWVGSIASTMLNMLAAVLDVVAVVEDAIGGMGEMLDPTGAFNFGADSAMQKVRKDLEAKGVKGGGARAAAEEIRGLLDRVNELRDGGGMDFIPPEAELNKFDGWLKRLNGDAEKLAQNGAGAVEGLRKQLDAAGGDGGDGGLTEMWRKRMKLQAELDRMTVELGGARTPGTDRMQRQIDELRQQEGAVDGLQKKLAGLKEAEELKKFGAGLMEEFKDPAEQAQDRIDRLMGALKAGVIDWETYQKAVDKVGESLKGAADAKDSWNAGGAMLEGSAAAISAMNRARFGDRVEKKEDQVKKAIEKGQEIMQEQKKIAEKHLAEAKAIGKALADAFGAGNLIPG